MDDQSHLDQEIVRLMDAVEEEKNYENDGYALLNIKTGFAVFGGVRINFTETNLLDNQIAMILPANFQSIPPEQVYKPEVRPNLLLADEDGVIQITIAHTQRKVSDTTDVITHKNEVKQILQTLNSALEWSEDGVKELQGRQLVYFEFVTPMLGASVYNLTFFMELSRRVLTGSFVCNAKKTKSWKPVFYQMMDSIKVLAEDTGEVILNHPDFSQYHFNEGLYGLYYNQEYRLFKVGPDSYRLVSDNPSNREDGFVARDGVFKKTVKSQEIMAAYRLKLTLIYHGYEFEMGQNLKNEVELISKNCDVNVARELQLEHMAPHEYSKIVAKCEIENVIETKLPVEGFVMPETISAD
jgi:hypothetical protein